MLSLNIRVEEDVGPRGGEPHPQLDVLDRGLREPLLVESTHSLERVPSNGSDPTPECGRGSSCGLVDVVMEQISEDRDDTFRFRTVVIGAEERREPRIGRECATDPAERIRVDLDVGVDEHEHVPRRVESAGVPGRGWTRPIGLSNDDDLLRTVGSKPNGLGTDRQGRGVVRGRNDRCQ